VKTVNEKKVPSSTRKAKGIILWLLVVMITATGSLTFVFRDKIFRRGETTTPASTTSSASSNTAGTTSSTTRTPGSYRGGPGGAISSVLPFASPLDNSPTQESIYLTYMVPTTPEDQTIEMIGTLEAQTRAVHAQISSEILQILVAEGDTVTPGTTLTVFDDLSQRITYSSRLNAYESSLGQSPRERELAALELEQARRSLDSAVLFSPVAGVISSIEKNVGEKVSEGTSLFSIVDMESMYISAVVDEADFHLLKKGMRAIVNFPNYDVSIPGKLRFISPVARTVSGVVVVPVEIALDQNPFEKGIIAGVTCDVELVVKAIDTGYTVPSAGVYSDTQGDYVLLLEGEKEQKSYVEKGEVLGNRVQLLSGISAGDTLKIVPNSSEASRLNGNSSTQTPTSGTPPSGFQPGGGRTQ